MPRLEALAPSAAPASFAFASQTETQGLVLAEALAAGLPVVALDGPGVADSVRDGVDGLIVRPAAPDADAAAVAGRRRCGAGRRPGAARAPGHAAREGAERFDVTRRIDEVVALYRELLADRLTHASAVRREACAAGRGVQCRPCE